ncbi:ferritin-like domain-containing protein [Wenyingzhuangia sp. IMCC45533]
MKTAQETITENLQGLLTRTHDSILGFEKASDKTKHIGLKTYFKTKASQRRLFASEIENEITRMGESFDSDSSTLGATHRAWMDLKAYFTDDNAEAMLEESITGEKKAIDDYKDVIYDTDTPPSIKEILKSQMMKIEEGLKTIKTLEDIK